MAKDPAFLFYSKDFLTGVADLTMEERGQYITLMCLQHQKGHLTTKTIRLSLGFDLNNQNYDVMDRFIQDENGNYYNAVLEDKIIKRQNSADAHRKAGLLGGRPPEKENQKVTQKATLIGTGNANGNGDVNKDKDREQMTEVFDLFWELYPKKKGKADARKAWKKIKRADVDAILAAINSSKQTRDWQKENGQYIPNPATWLNGERWNDEIEKPKQRDYTKGESFYDDDIVEAH